MDGTDGTFGQRQRKRSCTTEKHHNRTFSASISFWLWALPKHLQLPKTATDRIHNSKLKNQAGEHRIPSNPPNLKIGAQVARCIKSEHTSSSGGDGNGFLGPWQQRRERVVRAAPEGPQLRELQFSYSRAADPSRKPRQQVGVVAGDDSVVVPSARFQKEIENARSPTFVDFLFRDLPAFEGMVTDTIATILRGVKM